MTEEGIRAYDVGNTAGAAGSGFRLQEYFFLQHGINCEALRLKEEM